MIIKKVRLHNIRSYLDETIDFPDGSILLSGDIGSGKSTVLLAVEFALFGLERGILTGSSLLRNGKDEGFVELEIVVNGKPIKIKRSLQRNKRTRTVTQSYASIKIDGKETELTATELKSFVLSVLNYPSSLLKKKNLLYRYTVYCPQEEMKKILLENAETRLDTLRKVFDIDKYKRLSTNSELFVSKIKESIKEKEGQLVDLPFKKQQLEERKKAVVQLEKKIETLIPKLEKVKSEKLKIKEKFEEEEKEIKELIKERARIASIENYIEEKSSYVGRLEKERNQLDLVLKKLKEEVKHYSEEKFKEIEEAKTKIEKEIKDKAEKEKVIDKEISVIKLRKENLFKDLEKITSLDVCPTCKQKVTEVYKEKLKREINDEVSKLEKIEKEKEISLNEVRKTLEKLEKDSKKISEEEKVLFSLKLKFESLNEKSARLKEIEEEIKRLKNEIEKLKVEREKKKDLERRYEELERTHEITKSKKEEIENKEKSLLMEKAALEQGISDTKDEIKLLEKEIAKKQEIAKKLERLKELKEFLTKNFIALLELMEKQAMLKLRAEFNSLFQKWFASLVEDPNLTARIDIDFTPVIEQAGYEIEYQHLSGGERTALALAYRLALNQVINSTLSKLNTKDLLILDEPTDGFSYEQLDKMRDVLREIKAKQLILVSHEPKIESFVDHVIRFRKEGHVSKVIK